MSKKITFHTDFGENNSRITEDYITWSVKLNYTVHVICGLYYIDLKTEEFAKQYVFMYNKVSLLKVVLTSEKKKRKI